MLDALGTVNICGNCRLNNTNHCEFCVRFSNFIHIHRQGDSFIIKLANENEQLENWLTFITKKYNELVKTLVFKEA